MAKKEKQQQQQRICKTCAKWHNPDNFDFGNCYGVENQTDIRIPNLLLQTAGDFGCIKHTPIITEQEQKEEDKI